MTFSGYRRVVDALRRDPGHVIEHVIGRVGGEYYRFVFWLLRKRVRIGRRFQVRGKLIIRGPGRVEIGDRVLIDGRGHPVTPFTHHKDALIRIGDDVFVNGTRFGCGVEIDVGARSILSDARIADTDFHGLAPGDRHSAGAARSERIRIGENVWIGMGVYVLKGVAIGTNSVIGAGAVVAADIPADVVAAGNPARVVQRFAINGHSSDPGGARRS